MTSKRRAKFAIAAETWLTKNSPSAPVKSGDLWAGLCAEYPDLTTASERRKTPKATCMRDLRNDPAFSVADGEISLRLK